MEQQKMEQLFSYLDYNEEKFIGRLREAVAIRSVSQQRAFRGETVEMVQHFRRLLEGLGISCQMKELGEETFADGEVAPLPPVLLGHLGSDPQKKTVCIYGHIDVQPALKEDGWNTEPFVLTEVDGKLYGRGATDDKGPVLAWLSAIEAYQQTGTDVPVNVKFLFEAMEEAGSLGLEQLVKSLSDTFLADVDYFAISDSYWLGSSRPCVTNGLRGNAYFFVEIECAQKDLHSGVYGGAVHEAMADLFQLMSKLTDQNHNILVPGLMDDVLPVSMEDHLALEALDFDVTEFKEDVGTSKLRFDDKANLLAHRWMLPSLSIHGIEGAFSEPGAKTVIPRKVTCKFSIRLVPDQNPDKIGALVEKYLEEEFQKLDSPNSLRIIRQKASRPWVGDAKDANFMAARMAIEAVHHQEADLIREGCSIPIVLTLEEVTGKSVLLLPIGAADDGAHSQNEKIDRVNYANGAKVFAAYLHYLSTISVYKLFPGETDLVTNLPGVKFPFKYRNFSGYLEAGNKTFLHYWLFESQTGHSEKDPVVLWLNGGPGCSSLIGALTELGPIRLNEDGSISSNPFAWSQGANILFLESPGGVGFSFSLDSHYNYTDSSVAELNFKALRSFYKKFPHFAENDFYITGESYAGIYIPTLSVLVLEKKFPSKFKGVAIGNGMLDPYIFEDADLHYYFYHGMVGTEDYDDLLAKCCPHTSNVRLCKISQNRNSSCQAAVSSLRRDAGAASLNFQNLYKTCIPKHKNFSTSAYVTSQRSYEYVRRLTMLKLMNRQDEQLIRSYEPSQSTVCGDLQMKYMNRYLNKAEVKKALHIDSRSPRWIPCGLIQYGMEFSSMKSQVKRMVDGGLKVFIFHGDFDMLCNFLGGQWFTDDLGFRITKSTHPWTTPRGETAGFVKYYEKGLVFTTVFGAGHMVPQDKGEAALKIVNTLISNSTVFE